jgi:hypothetical protein
LEIHHLTPILRPEKYCPVTPKLLAMAIVHAMPAQIVITAGTVIQAEPAAYVLLQRRRPLLE